MWIFLALIAVPIIEISLFIQVGGVIGLWPTIGLVLFTAVAGAVLLRAQGFAAMTRLQTSLNEGGDPRGPLAHGAFILLAGLLMLTPGFFTDTIGFLLLVPPVRASVIAWLAPRIAARVVTARSPRGPMARPDHAADHPIDVEYKDVTDTEPARRGDSGWTRPPE